MSSTMKKILFYAIPLALIGSACAPQPVATEPVSAPAITSISDADKASFQESSNKFTVAFMAGDFDTMANMYTTDGVLMPPNSPEAAGREAIKKFLGSMPGVKDFSIAITNVDGSGDTAIVVGTFAITFVMPDKTEAPDKGKFIEIRKKQADGTWLMSRDMFSSDMPMAMEPAPKK